MNLNWTPEAIVDLIVAIIILSASILTYIAPKTKKIKSLFYLRLGIMFMGIFLLLEGFSFIFGSILLNQIHTITIFFAALFTLIGINYTMKENFLSINLIPILCLGIPLVYLTFQPGMIVHSSEYGYPTIIWRDLLFIVGNIFQFYVACAVFYWGLKTWINAPFLIKRDANFFMIGIIFVVPITFSIYFFSYWIPSLILLADITLALGLIIFMVFILKEPKLLYILPFTINRILIKDKQGYPLFDHDWSESNIDEMMFTGFINAVQLMSEEVMNIGGLVNINLEEGILILYESELVTVGLVASKTSKLLRESLVNFSNEFQQFFRRELKKSIRDMSAYEPAYFLIDKYFSNFPFRIIPSKSHPLLLSGKYAEIPLELEDKLKYIFTDGQEYEYIKSEILKSPIYTTEEFLNLYEELSIETDRIPKEDFNELNEEKDKE